MRARSFALITLSIAASLFACNDPANDGAEGGEATAEHGETLTLAANMVWSDPADATIKLIPGDATDGVTDASPGSHEVFKVLVDPRANTQNGSVIVSKFWKDAPASSCASRTLSARVQARSGLFFNYSDLKVADVTSVFTVSNGEFPVQGCTASVTVPYGPSVLDLRVMAQARSLVTFNGLSFWANTAASVVALGKSAAPHLVASIQIDPDGAANAVIVNNGPVTAPGVDADLSYNYDYCPPALSGESPYCVLSSLDQGECVGPYCGPGTWGFGQRQPIKCSWTKNDLPLENIPANGGVLNWIWHTPGVQSRCGLCVPNDNRCANPHAHVAAESTGAPYDQMSGVGVGTFESGVF